MGNSDERSRWESVRRAVGVVKGQPADAVEDTSALYDDPPPFQPTSMPTNLFPEYIMCSDRSRHATMLPPPADWEDETE